MLLRTKNSRYELTQDLLFNPNGLVYNTNNECGIVDALGNISRETSCSHVDTSTYIASSVLISQPKLELSYWSNQNAINFAGDKLFRRDTNYIFDWEWDTPQYIAFKFQTSQVGTHWILYNGEYNLAGGGALTGVRIVLSAGQIVIVYEAWTGSVRKFKNIRTASTYNDGLPHTIAFENDGSDDANNYNIYVDGVLVSKTVTVNDSFIGASMYPDLYPRRFVLGASNLYADFFNSYIGKLIISKQAFNPLAVHSSLNSDI